MASEEWRDIARRSTREGIRRAFAYSTAVNGFPVVHPDFIEALKDEQPDLYLEFFSAEESNVEDDGKLTRDRSTPENEAFWDYSAEASSLTLTEAAILRIMEENARFKLEVSNCQTATTSLSDRDAEPEGRGDG